MDSQTGVCQSTTVGYSGPLTPLDEEVSMHFRGPLVLKQFAVYTPGTGSSKKRSVRQTHHDRRHGHQKMHERNREVREIEDHVEEVKRGVGSVVTMTMANGKVITFTNAYGSAAATTSTHTTSTHTTSTATVVAATSSSAPSSSAYAAAATSSSAPSSSAYAAAATAASSASSSSSTAAYASAASGSWTRQAYYSSDQGTADGLVFLNNMGGGGSGVFDYTFGASLSYASSDATGSAASAQVLSGSILDNNEIIIMTNTPCENGDCGYTRPGTVPYHGFGGAEKVFLMEFSMPLSGCTTGGAPDMPAIWMLNAQIPRTLQYGLANCSCWTSGCGELDLFEVLSMGNTYATTTLHLTSGCGGSTPNYFSRPTSTTIKAAVVFKGDNQTANIRILDDSQTFDSALAASTIEWFCSDSNASTITPIYPG
ncbi:Domain of unknown function DUF2403, glycine-rich [Lasallia pustulata]|uniref:glucan endo-1,3-beta-D-glucosidase n=1 Tax=Lasallia pustulata TaxID=136370 RepID=A0A1W5CTN7_9LECA|nr:Domain of unknown function DUF2403, glycine-rich [Lasallia pustulata]